FERQNGRDFMGSHDARDIGGAGRELDLIRITVQHALHGIAKIERTANGFRPFIKRGHPEREEWRVHASFLETHQVDLAVGEFAPDIHVLYEHALHGVDMSIDAYDLRLEAARPLCNVISRAGRHYEDGEGKSKFHHDAPYNKTVATPVH